jgi:hypothetical protein
VVSLMRCVDNTPVAPAPRRLPLFDRMVMASERLRDAPPDADLHRFVSRSHRF